MVQPSRLHVQAGRPHHKRTCRRDARTTKVVQAGRPHHEIRYAFATTRGTWTRTIRGSSCYSVSA